MTDTPYVSIVDGKARNHNNSVQACMHAVERLQPQHATAAEFMAQTDAEAAARKATYDTLCARIEAGEVVTHEGRTAAIYPVEAVDHWAGEDREDYRGGWDEFGGGVEVAGLEVEDPENGDSYHDALARQGYEVKYTTEDDPDDSDLSTDLTAWRPLPPEGDGWVLHSALQSEDGDLIAHWIRPAVRPAA